MHEQEDRRGDGEEERPAAPPKASQPDEEYERADDHRRSHAVQDPRDGRAGEAYEDECNKDDPPRRGGPFPDSSLRGQLLHGEVLRLSCPSHKCLAGAFQPSPAEQIRQSEGRVPLTLARHEDQCR
jgi:hypothetical protein